MEINKHNYRSVPKVEQGDRIVFTNDLIYYVRINHLGAEKGYNQKVFDYLGVDKYDFCETAYGYRCVNGDCPECKRADYKALHRLIIAIFDKLYPEKVQAAEELKECWEKALLTEDKPKECSKSAEKKSSELIKVNVKFSSVKPKIVL